MPILLTILLIAAEPLTAAASQADLPPAKQDEGEMICKRFTELGSRLTNKKVCKTRKEWEESRSQNSEVIRQQRGAAGGPQPGNGSG